MAALLIDKSKAALDSRFQIPKHSRESRLWELDSTRFQSPFTHRLSGISGATLEPLREKNQTQMTQFHNGSRQKGKAFMLQGKLKLSPCVLLDNAILVVSAN